MLLVNAVMDGLNLVAKEAPLVNTRDGVVVLSVNTGAYEEIGEWTVSVDPFDVEGQADGARGGALAAARRSAAHGWMRSASTCASHDLEAWIDAQLADLDRASTMRRR